jgi:hypothetical protein
VTLGTFGEAAAHGEVVLNTTAGAVSLEALEQAKGELQTSSPRYRHTPVLASTG